MCLNYKAATNWIQSVTNVHKYHSFRLRDDEVTEKI